MDEGGDFVVIYTGRKFFWGMNNTVEITIVQHTSADVTEIICYDATLDRESSRIYLDSAILSVKVDQNDIAEKLNFVNDAVHRATADFILNRLVVTAYSVDLKEFAVRLKLYLVDRDLDGDCDAGVDSLICAKPAGLRCYAIQPKLMR